MSKQRDDTFIVKAENALKALPFWFKDKGANTYSWGDQKTINVGYDTRPDSDWGGKYTWLGRVVVLDETLFDRTRQTLDAAMAKAFHQRSQAFEAEVSKITRRAALSTPDTTK